MDDGRFARDTAVTADADRRWHARVVDGWSAVDGAAPNGGYLLAIAARAMAAQLGQPDPATVTGHFLSPASTGEVVVDVHGLREAGRHRTATARMLQNDQTILQATGTFTDLAAVDGASRTLARPPDWPEPDECTPADSAGLTEEATRALDVPVRRRLGQRYPPALLGWCDRAPSGNGTSGGYARWEDDAPMDPLGLLVVADAFPPAIFDLDANIGIGWVPTLALTVDVFARPPEGDVTARFVASSVINGYVVEDGEIFGADGGLVARAHQVARTPRP